MQVIDNQEGVDSERISGLGSSDVIFKPSSFTKDRVLDNIVRLRTRKKLTKRAMAIGMGINEVSYARIESGEIALTYDHIYKIAYILKMSVISLITYPCKYVDIHTYMDKMREVERDAERREELVRKELKELIDNLTMASKTSDSLIEETKKLQMQVEYLKESVKDKDMIIHLITSQNKYNDKPENTQINE